MVANASAGLISAEETKCRPRLRADAELVDLAYCKVGVGVRDG